MRWWHWEFVVFSGFEVRDVDVNNAFATDTRSDLHEFVVCQLADIGKENIVGASSKRVRDATAREKPYLSTVLQLNVFPLEPIDEVRTKDRQNLKKPFA